MLADESHRWQNVSEDGVTVAWYAGDDSFGQAIRANDAVHAAVEHLDERERMIVRERFMKEDPPTLQELGVRLGVSKERVRQLEERARAKLRGELSELAELVA
jgi:RNA polymerase sigma-32 factor